MRVNCKNPFQLHIPFPLSYTRKKSLIRSLFGSSLDEKLVISSIMAEPQMGQSSKKPSATDNVFYVQTTSHQLLSLCGVYKFRWFLPFFENDENNTIILIPFGDLKPVKVF